MFALSESPCVTHRNNMWKNRKQKGDSDSYGSIGKILDLASRPQRGEQGEKIEQGEKSEQGDIWGK